MRYLCTGGTGVIGSLFAKSRLMAGENVVVLDDGTSKRHAFNAWAIPRQERDPNLSAVRARLGDRLHEQAAVIGDIDRILHAAASTGIPYSGQAPLDDWSRNVDGTIEVLEAVRANPKPLVVLSSVKPYSTKGLVAMERDDRYVLSGYGVNEDCKLEPDEPYAASKAAQSLVSQAYARQYDLPIVVFRCSNLYGPAAVHGPRHGWLGWLCIQAALGWTIEIQGSGKQTRDMLFASDVESAALAAFGALESGDVERGRIFNIGGGASNTISVLQAVEMLRGMGANFDTRSAPGRKNEDMLFVTDSSAIQRELGWKPEVTVRDGMARVYAWACENRDALAVVYEEHVPK